MSLRKSIAKWFSSRRRPIQNSRTASGPRKTAALRFEVLEERLAPANGTTIDLSPSGVLQINVVGSSETATLTTSGNEITVTDSVTNGLIATTAAQFALGFPSGPSTSLTSSDAGQGGLQNDTVNVNTIEITGAGKVVLGPGASGILNAGWTLEVDTSGLAAGAFDLAGNIQTVNTLNDGIGGSGKITASAAGSTLTVNNGGSFGGIIDGVPVNLGLTVAGGTLTLTGANTYTGGTTIDSGATLQLGNGTTNGTLAGGGAVTDDGTLVVDPASPQTVGNSISGTGAVTIDAGTVTLSGTNTYSGATTIDSAATLAAGNGNGLSPNSSFDISAGGFLDLDGHNAKVGALTGSGTVTDSATSGTNTLTVEGTSTFYGVIQNGTATVALTVDSSGSTLTLAGSNTYTGTTTINANDTLQLGDGATYTASLANAGNITDNGTLTIAPGAPTSYATTVGNKITGTGTVIVANGTVTLSGSGSNYSGTTTIDAGATLQVGAANATSANSTINLAATGVLDLIGNSTAIGGLTGSGTVTNSATAANATLTVEASSSFAGAIQDGSSTTALTVDGGGGKALTLTGTANSYSGTTTVDTGDTLAVGAANATSPNSSINLVGTGTLDLGGFSTAVAGLSGSGGSTVTNNGGTAATLTVGATSSFDGALADGISPLALTVGGSATTFTLIHADNTYSGMTTIDAGGTLQSGVTNATSPNSIVSIAATGFLDLAGNNTKVGGLTGTGTVTDSGAPGPDTLTLEGSGTFGGVIQDGASATVALTVDSSGITVVLTGTNTYTGTTTINADDTLQLGDGATYTGSLAGAGTIADNGTLTIAPARAGQLCDHGRQQDHRHRHSHRRQWNRHALGQRQQL